MHVKCVLIEVNEWKNVQEREKNKVAMRLKEWKKCFSLDWVWANCFVLHREVRTKNLNKKVLIIFGEITRKIRKKLKMLKKGNILYRRTWLIYTEICCFRRLVRVRYVFRALSVCYLWEMKKYRCYRCNQAWQES